MEGISTPLSSGLIFLQIPLKTFVCLMSRDDDLVLLRFLASSFVAQPFIFALALGTLFSICEMDWFFGSFFVFPDVFSEGLQDWLQNVAKVKKKHFLIPTAFNSCWTRRLSWIIIVQINFPTSDAHYNSEPRLKFMQLSHLTLQYWRRARVWKSRRKGAYAAWVRELLSVKLSRLLDV